MNNKAIMNYEYSTEFESFITDNIGEIENIVHDELGGKHGKPRQLFDIVQRLRGHGAVHRYHQRLAEEHVPEFDLLLAHGGKVQ